MKSFIHKSLAILMAFVVLGTTMSFTVNMHYCGSELIDFSLFSKAESCGIKVLPAACDPVAEKTSCCSDENIIVEGQDDLKPSFDSISLEQQSFLFSFVYSFVSLYTETEEDFIPFKYYSPPVLIRDIQILNQTFLI